MNLYQKEDTKFKKITKNLEIMIFCDWKQENQKKSFLSYKAKSDLYRY